MMRKEEGMTAGWERVHSEFQEGGAKLKNLNEALIVLESDLELVEHENWVFYFCLDFRDLFRYLGFDLSSVVEKSEDRARASLDYATVLLFHEMQNAPVIFPWYLIEFSRKISRMLAQPGKIDEYAEDWARRFKRDIEREARLPGGLLEYAIGMRNRDTEMNLTELEERLDEFLLRIRELLKHLSEVLRGAQFVQRFDWLVCKDRIRSLKSIFGSETDIDFKKDAVFGEAKRLLDDLRPTRSINNETDALALAAIAQLNWMARDENSHYVLVTSDTDFLRVIERIKTGLQNGDLDTRISYRRWDYWMLYFALKQRVEVSGRSIFGELEYLKKEAQKDIWRLWREYNRLVEWMGSVDLEESELVSERRLRELIGFARKVDKVLVDLAEPMLETRWRLNMVEDSISDISVEEGELKEAIDAFHDLVNRIKFGNAPIEDVCKKLEIFCLKDSRFFLRN
jgi:hypothetical protein